MVLAMWWVRTIISSEKRQIKIKTVVNKKLMFNVRNLASVRMEASKSVAALSNHEIVENQK